MSHLSVAAAIGVIQRLVVEDAQEAGHVAGELDVGPVPEMVQSFCSILGLSSSP